MRRVFGIVLALALMMAICCPVFADETFVPSISEKPAPEIVVDDNGYIGVVLDDDGNVISNIHADCLLITPVSEAESSESIPADAKEMLLYVYYALLSGEMTIPAEKLDENLSAEEVTVRDLFDLHWLCEEHREMVEPEGVVFQVTFKTNMAADAELFAMTYKNSEWNPIVSAVNNGDGTLTCTFEDLCPVAFIYGADQDVPETGVFFSTQMMLWVAVLVVSSIGLVAMVATRRKSNRA